MKLFQKIIFSGYAVASLICLNGCATATVPEVKLQSESIALAENLRNLSHQVDPTEAALAADIAVRYPLKLASEYDVTPPALFNNVLINCGIHPRGLCFQWADDLTIKLLTLHLQTLEPHRGVAHLGTKREHSSVVLTAPGQPFNDGIALDAWRDCGKIHWSPVTTDKYPWKEVKLTSVYQAKLDAAAEKLEAPSK